MKMCPVVHFEIPADDRKRASDFYAQAFGWQANQLGEDMGNYVMVSTSESDKKTGFPHKPGMINGGIYDRSKETPEKGPHLVLSVDDLKQHMKAVTEAGGKILGEPMNIAGIGEFVMFEDTEGNRNGMLQPVPMPS